MSKQKNNIFDTKSPERYNTIVKSNRLIQQSRFSLSAQQQKVILYIISQIDRQDEEFKIYSFSIKEFCQVCGILPKGDMYSLLKKQIKDIADKSIWIQTEEGNDTLVRWIDKPIIDSKSGTIHIKLDNDMKPYLLQLKEKFTEYELIYTLNFKSKYSIRLYEYLKSIHYDKLKPYTQIIDIDKFQTLLDSTYNSFKDFNKRVLLPSHKEINLYSDINFDYELIKIGTKVSSIKITISTKDIVNRLTTVGNIEKILDERNGDTNE